MSIDTKEMRVLEYLEGEMTAEQEKVFLADTAADPELAALLAEYREQDSHLHAYFESQATAAEAKASRPDLEKLPVALAARPRTQSRRTWLMAAAACLGLLAGTAVYLKPEPHRSPIESVRFASGGAQVYNAGSVKPVAADRSEPARIERLRTPARAQLELALTNGLGTLEVRENSTVRVGNAEGLVELGLERGELLVGATAASAEKSVRVVTPYFEATASSPATFSVVKGIRGAEVAVVSGDVEVRAAGSRQTVAAGKSFSSTGSEPLAVARRIEWSRHREELLAMLPADASLLTAPEASESVEVAIATEAASPEAAGSETAVKSVAKSAAAVSAATADTSRYLPAGTISLIEVPSLEALLQARGASNLADVFLSGDAEVFVQSSAANLEVTQKEFEAISAEISRVFTNEDLSLMLESIAGSVSIGITPNGPILVADVTTNAAAVSQLVNGRLAPKLIEGAEERDGLRAAVVNGRLVIGVDREEFAATAAALESAQPTEFAGSAFLGELRAVAPGSRFSAALDAQALVRSVSGNNEGSVFFRNLGLGNMQTVVAATSFADQARNQALRVTFDGPRQGVVSWLDEPGPLSSFQFFTPDAHAVLAARVRRPEEILGQFLGWVGPEKRNPEETPSGEALVRRLAATLGNEVAIGLDNPVLPVPNIKFAIEVLDPEGFHNGMVELMDEIATVPGSRSRLEVHAETYRDHLVVDFTWPDTPYGVSYAVVNDFVILGPGRPFLQSTIDIATEKQSLNEEYAFNAALPARSGSHCSALAYVAANGSMGEAAPVLEALLKNYHVPIDISGLRGTGSDGTKAAVYYAIAEDNRIDLFIEGFRGDYRMTGVLPSVAEWIRTNGK